MWRTGGDLMAACDVLGGAVLVGQAAHMCGDRHITSHTPITRPQWLALARRRAPTLVPHKHVLFFLCVVLLACMRHMGCFT